MKKPSFTKEPSMRRGRPRKTFIPKRTQDLFAQYIDTICAQEPYTIDTTNLFETNNSLSFERQEKDPALSIFPLKKNRATKKEIKEEKTTQEIQKPLKKKTQRTLRKEHPLFMLETKSMTQQRLVLFDIAPWSSNMRAMPNDYARSALFTVRNKRIPRQARQGFPIFHVNEDVQITYTGIELRAEDDELVWQQVLEYAKQVPAGDPITFTFHRLCLDLGWSINGQYYKKAEECLSRLQASAMQFSSRRLGRIESISLIRRFRLIDHGARQTLCQVEIDMEMILLFAGGNYTRFVWEKYRKLSPTARRMFDYFASHKKPFPIKLETFRLMCGSDSTRRNRWKEQVSHACAELCASGLVKDAFLQKDMLHCQR